MAQVKHAGSFRTRLCRQAHAKDNAKRLELFARAAQKARGHQEKARQQEAAAKAKAAQEAAAEAEAAKVAEAEREAELQVRRAVCAYVRGTVESGSSNRRWAMRAELQDSCRALVSRTVHLICCAALVWFQGTIVAAESVLRIEARLPGGAGSCGAQGE